MTHKKLVYRRIRRLIYFILLGLSYAGIFVFMDNDFLACSSLILSIAFLFLFIMSFSNKYRVNKKLQDAIKKSMFDNPVSLNEVNLRYRYKGLDSSDKNVLKVLFHKNNTKRCVIYQESNSVRISFESLEYYDDDTKSWTYDFAQWVPSGVESGIYSDMETALNDNERFLDDYKEEKVNIVKKQSYFAEIEWKNLTIDSKEIPFGSYNTFDIKFKGQVFIDVIIHNKNWLDFSTSIANIYVNEKDNINLKNKSKFYIYKDNQIVGVGYCNNQY